MNKSRDNSEPGSKHSDDGAAKGQVEATDEKYQASDDIELARGSSPHSNGVRSNFVERGYEKLSLASPGKDPKLNDAYASAVDLREARDEYLENLNLNEQTVSQGGQGQGNQSGVADHAPISVVQVDGRASVTEPSAHVGVQDDALTSSHLNLTKKIAAKYPGSNAASDSASGTTQLCDVHSKGIQGYCLEDRRVLCIDCILSGDHKNHEICAIDKAAKQERDGLTKKFQHSKVLKDMLGASIQKIRSHEELLKTTTQDYLQKVAATMQEVRQQLEERERQIISELDAKLQKELKHLGNKEREAQAQLTQIDAFQAQWHQLGEIDDAYLLKNIEQQFEEAGKATAEPKPVRYNQVVPGKFNRENEVAALSKYILSCAPVLGAPTSASLIGSVATTRDHFSTISHPDTTGAKTVEERAAMRARPRRDTSMIGKVGATVPSRSTSIKPSLGTSAGAQTSQIDNQQTQHNSSTHGAGTSNSTAGKASYMQATSSWAKRKAELVKDKEREADQKQQQVEKRAATKPGFKLHLGHSLQHGSKESPAPVHINLNQNNKAGEQPQRFDRLGGRDAQHSQRDPLVRRDRLVGARDKKINPLNATSNLNYSNRQKTMTSLSITQTLATGQHEIASAGHAPVQKTARSPDTGSKPVESAVAQTLPPRSAKIGDPPSDKKRNPKKLPGSSLHNSQLPTRVNQSALGTSSLTNQNQKVTPTKKPAPSAVLLGTKDKHYLNPKLRGKAIVQSGLITASKVGSDTKVLDQDRPKGSFQAAAAARTRSQVRQTHQSFSEQEGSALLRKVEPGRAQQAPRRSKGWPARVNTSLGQAHDRGTVAGQFFQQDRSHGDHPLTATALEKMAAGDDSSEPRDYEDSPAVTAQQSTELAETTEPGRQAANLGELNSASVTLRDTIDPQPDSRQQATYGVNSAQVSARGLEPSMNSFQKAAALRRSQKKMAQSTSVSPTKEKASPQQISPAAKPFAPDVLSGHEEEGTRRSRARRSQGSAGSGRQERHRSTGHRSHGASASPRAPEQTAQQQQPKHQPLLTLAQRRDEMKQKNSSQLRNRSSEAKRRPPADDQHSSQQRFLNSTIEVRPLKELVEMPSNAESSSSQHDQYHDAVAKKDESPDRSRDLLKRLRDIQDELHKPDAGVQLKHVNPYEDRTSDQLQTVADFRQLEAEETRIRSPNMLRTSHQRSDKVLSRKVDGHEDSQPIATASINLVAADSESLGQIGNMSMNRTRQALMGGDLPVGTESELGDAAGARGGTILTEESAQSPARVPAQRASHGILRDDSVQDDNSVELAYRDEGVRLKQSINSAVPVRRKQEERLAAENVNSEYMTNPLLTSDLREDADQPKDSQAQQQNKASVAGKSTRQKWQTNRKNSVRETSLPRQLAMDNANAYELARAPPEEVVNVEEESKQAVRADQYNRHAGEGVKEAPKGQRGRPRDGIQILLYDSTEGASADGSGVPPQGSFVASAVSHEGASYSRDDGAPGSGADRKSLAQYLDAGMAGKPDDRYADVTRESLDISYLRSPEREAANNRTQQTATSGLKAARRDTEPMFAIYCISGYCDSPLVSTEKMTITLASLNQPEQFWNETGQRAKPIQMISGRPEPSVRLLGQHGADQMNYASGVQPGAHQTGGWVMAGDLNVARTKFQAVVLPRWSKVNRPRDQLWILGGKNSQSQRIASIEIYDQQNEAWAMDPERIRMRKPKSGFAAVYYRGGPRNMQEQLLVIGGNDGQVQNRVEFMNLQDFQWHKCASMISRRDELAACVGPDNMIYAIGGYGGSANSSCLNSVERYDCAANRWEAVAPMNEGRRALAALAMPDGIYAIGGYNGKDYIATVERYDINADKWTIVSKLNSPKCTMTAVASPNFKTFYVIGGFNGMQLNEVEIYDPQTQQFRLMKYSLAQKRFMHSSAVLIS